LRSSPGTTTGRSFWHGIKVPADLIVAILARHDDRAQPVALRRVS
jgi:hypothetical protein